MTSSILTKHTGDNILLLREICKQSKQYNIFNDKIYSFIDANRIARKEAFMLKIIKHQTSFILRQNMSLAVFFVLLSIVFLNFRSNVLAFQGSDIIEMYHPAKLLALSYDQVYNNMDIMLLLIQLYPILIVCPAGFTLLSEKKRKTDCVLIARIGGT